MKKMREKNFFGKKHDENNRSAAEAALLIILAQNCLSNIQKMTFLKDMYA